MKLPNCALLLRLLGIVLSFCISSAAYAICSKTLEVGFFDIEPAFNEQGEVVKPSDSDILMVQDILKTAGCAYHMVKAPWPRIVTAVRYGKLDVTFGASSSEERREIAYMSMPYREEVIGMVMRKPDMVGFHPQNFGDIVQSNFKIGIRLGIYYGKDFEFAQKQNPAFKSRILRAAGSGHLLNWVVRRRVDILLMESRTCHYFIESNGLENLLGVHPYAVNRGSIHIMLSKASTTEGDVNVINEAIISYQKTMRYKKLVARFSN